MLLKDTQRPILFFDGECNLCNRAVQYVIRHDKKEQFLFGPLQSGAGKELLEVMPGNAPDSMILYYRGMYYTRSNAALHTARLLGGWRSWLYALTVLPCSLRDPFYNLIARNRYNWFGKSDTCMVPTKELEARFLL